MTNSSTNTLTMSSREIADVVEKRHDNVKRTIESLMVRCVIESPQSEEIRTATNRGVIYRVTKRDSYVIVAQLSPEFTARLVDRWQELEKQVAQPQVPQSFAQALRLAADTQEQLEQEKLQKEEAQQKASSYQKVIGTNRHALGKFARTLPGVNILKIKSELVYAMTASYRLYV